MRKVETIKFETTNDVVDYVCKGLPPRKSDYEKLVTTLRCSEEDAVCHIDPIVTTYIDTETFTKVLDRVYEDNVRNRNIAIGIGLAVGVCVIRGMIELCKKNDNDEKE